MRKQGIPSTPQDPFSKVVRERLETLAGERGAKIKPLVQDASLSDVIDKINEIIALIQ